MKGRLRAREGVRIPGVGRLLHAYWRFSRGLTLGVRTVVIDGRERVFLVRHTYAHGWHFPGGGVEPGEAALDAARRELREEAADRHRRRAAAARRVLQRSVSRRDHVVVYLVRDFRVIAEKAPDREIAEARFFPLDALPPGLTRGTRARLAEIAGGGPVSARW